MLEKAILIPDVIEILCDFMSCKGSLTSINRQGINLRHVGPLVNVALKIYRSIKCMVFSQRQFISSNIMMGQTIKSGTGFCDVLLDEANFIKNITYDADD